ncbi:uncharacterized protein LOC126378853 [Pectinophora gossypiella]|nr:uncharacterized protein LOC126378853 [Pectinophora gossypiella]
MNALWFLAFLAVAAAGPMRSQFDPFADHGNSDENHFGSEIFDTRRFWNEMTAELHRLDEMMNEFYKNFPVTSSESGVKGNEYIVTVNLIGYDEEDIKVKAKEGVLMIQAVHQTNDGSQSSYLDLKTLPSYVNVNGSWTYDAGVLRIVFPLNSQPDGAATETAPVTDASNIDVRGEEHSREEMDNSHHGDAEQDADVGLETSNRDNEILTNVIARENTVEATTYAVDLKNEVEFVPVKY